MEDTPKKKLSLIAFSGEFDKLTAVFTLATGAAAVGYEVNIFFTFWGLDAISPKTEPLSRRLQSRPNAENAF